MRAEPTRNAAPPRTAKAARYARQANGSDTIRQGKNHLALVARDHIPRALRAAGHRRVRWPLSKLAGNADCPAGAYPNGHRDIDAHTDVDADTDRDPHSDRDLHATPYSAARADRHATAHNAADSERVHPPGGRTAGVLSRDLLNPDLPPLGSAHLRL